MNKPVSVIGITVFFAAVIAGCGGGGGGGGGSSMMPTSPCTGIEISDGCISQEEFDRRRDAIARRHLLNTEFQAQWGLESTNVHEAHAALEVKHGSGVKPGAGATVGVMDDGFFGLNDPEFTGADITEISTGETLGDLIHPDPNNPRDNYHGTLVTSVIATQSNGNGFIGVAPGAAIKIFPLDLRKLKFFSEDEDNARFLRDVVFANNLDILNMSFGLADLSENLVENSTEQDLRNQIPHTIAALAQAGVEEKTILVWAAGNGHCPSSMWPACDPNTPPNPPLDANSPTLFSGLAVHIAELAGHSVDVVAVGRDGTIADFSNRCGIAKDFCIAAPGVDVAVAAAGSGTTVAPGTSFAAPMVSGGLALMKHFFRDQLSNTELVTRLFATSDKTGIYSDQAVYGQGLMDLGAAVTPVGNTRVTMGNQVGGAGSLMQATRLRLGGAFGDSLSRSLAGHEIAAFDTLGSPFWFDLSSLAGGYVASTSSPMQRLNDLMTYNKETRHPWAGHSARTALDLYGNPFHQHSWQLGFYERPVAAESSVFNLAEHAAAFTYKAQNGLETTLFTTAGLAGNHTPETGAMLAWRPSEAFGLRAGWLGERKAMLGSRADGAFGALSANSFVTGFETGTEFKGWHLAADAEVGVVTSDTRGGILTGLSEVYTSAFSLRAHRSLTAQDEITFSVSQPPRIEHGSAGFTVPVGRTKAGTVLHESISASLVPSGRQIDVSARWQREDTLGGEFRTEVTASRHPGHMDENPEFSLLAGWKTAF